VKKISSKDKFVNKREKEEKKKKLLFELKIQD
jgi:hypothetical protein